MRCRVETSVGGGVGDAFVFIRVIEAVLVVAEVGRGNPRC